MSGSAPIGGTVRLGGANPVAAQRTAERRLALLTQLHEDWDVNGRSAFRPGFQAVAVYRFGVWQSRLPRVLRLPLGALYRAAFIFVRNFYGIELYYTTTVGRRLRLGHQSGIVIHYLAEIGDDCSIRQNVTLGAARPPADREAPKLGNDVRLGAGAVILGPVTIGDGVRIGPNAVVMTDVPAGAAVFAPPARIMTPPKRRNAAPGGSVSTEAGDAMDAQGRG